MAGVKVLHDGRAIGSWTDTSRALSSMDPYIYQINKNIFNLNFFPFAISNFKRRLCSSLAAFNKQTNKTKMGRRIVSKGTSEKVQSLKCINKTICLHHAKENEAPRQRQAKCIRRRKSEGAKKKASIFFTSLLSLFENENKKEELSTTEREKERERERERVYRERDPFRHTSAGNDDDHHQAIGRYIGSLLQHGSCLPASQGSL